jgi:hypothetical protein
LRRRDAFAARTLQENRDGVALWYSRRGAMGSCRHPICELIGGGECSISSGRSRGCTPGLAAKTIDAAVFDEVRALLAAIATGDHDAAIRLAAIVRREAREDRNLLAHARDDEPELAARLAELLVRR